MRADKKLLQVSYVEQNGGDQRLNGVYDLLLDEVLRVMSQKPIMTRN